MLTGLHFPENCLDQSAQSLKSVDDPDGPVTAFEVRQTLLKKSEKMENLVENCVFSTGLVILGRLAWNPGFDNVP